MDYPVTIYAMPVSTTMAGIPENFTVSIEALRVTKISETKMPYVTAWTVDDYVYNAQCHEIAMKVFWDPNWITEKSIPSLYVFRNKLYQTMTADEFETICVITRVDNIVRSATNIAKDIQNVVSDSMKAYVTQKAIER